MFLAVPARQCGRLSRANCWGGLRRTLALSLVEISLRDEGCRQLRRCERLQDVTIRIIVARDTQTYVELFKATPIFSDDSFDSRTKSTDSTASSLEVFRISRPKDHATPYDQSRLIVLAPFPPRREGFNGNNGNHVAFRRIP